MVQYGNVMVLVCSFVPGRKQTNACCLLQSRTLPGPQNNLYQAPDHFITNPEEDRWLTDETSSEALSTANRHDTDINYVSSLPLHWPVLLMNIL